MRQSQTALAGEREPRSAPMRAKRSRSSLCSKPEQEEHMHVTTRTTLAVCALVAAIAPTAAAATLTKSQVITRGTVICKAAERRVDATPGPRSQNPFAPTAPKGDAQRAIRFMAVYASSLESVRVGLGRLAASAPAQDRGLLTVFVAELKPTVAAFRAGHDAAVAHHYDRAMSDAQRGFMLFSRASAKTKAYGFPKGVCQSGSS
jgi:hypothetical protein